MLLNDDENEMLKNDLMMEDEMAIQYSRDKQIKMSPNNLVSSSRKGAQVVARH